jgi:hypothetical protein
MELIAIATLDGGTDAWAHLLLVTRTEYPDAFDELNALADDGAALRLWLTDSGSGYAMTCGQGLSARAHQALAATAAEVYEHELNIGTFHAQRVSAGFESFAYGAANCPGPVIGGAFRAELDREHQRRAARAKRKRRTFGRKASVQRNTPDPQRGEVTISAGSR